MKLENKVAIVTGAGSGMGKAIAGLFAKEGAKVIASDINETGVKDLIASSGDIAGEIVFSQTDVSNRNQVETMIDLAVNKYGKLDVLVNNAGVLDKMYSVTEVEDEFWDKVMSININSVMYACRKAIPIMMKNGGGSIINTASVGGLFGCRAGAAYTASKFAVVGLTKNILCMQKKVSVVMQFAPEALLPILQQDFQMPVNLVLLVQVREFLLAQEWVNRRKLQIQHFS